MLLVHGAHRMAGDVGLDLNFAWQRAALAHRLADHLDAGFHHAVRKPGGLAVKRDLFGMFPEPHLLDDLARDHPLRIRKSAFDRLHPGK